MRRASTRDEQVGPETSRCLIYRHDFFQIGGHSLLGPQVLVRVREIAMGLPLRSLFQGPTDILDRIDGLSEREMDALLAITEEEMQT